MSFDDFDQENPVAGKGDEMIPDRGIPFEDDDLQDMLADFESEETTFEFSSDLEPDTLSNEAAGFNAGDRDGGMGAAFPMNPDDTFDDLPALPQDELVLPSLDEDLGGGTEMFMAPAPGLEVIPDRPVSNNIAPEKTLLETYVTDDRMKLLWQRIDQAQRNTRDHVPNLDIAHDLLAQIERARNEFLADVGNYEEVEHIIGAVELRLVVIDRAIRDTPYANRLFIYEFAWALVFGLTLLFLRIFYTTMDPELGVILFSMGLSGLGSVVRAMYALWQHTAQEINFSRQYSMWYIIFPILGPFLGIFVFLVMKAGIISISGPSSASEPISPYTIYLLAFLTGFQQNVAWDMIRRIKQVFFPDSASS